MNNSRYVDGVVGDIGVVNILLKPKDRNFDTIKTLPVRTLTVGNTDLKNLLLNTNGFHCLVIV